MRKILQKITSCGRTMAVGEKCDHVHGTPPPGENEPRKTSFSPLFRPKTGYTPPEERYTLHLFAFFST
jgi:hypothetical protein